MSRLEHHVDRRVGHPAHLAEPGLAELVQRNARAGRLVFTTDTAEAVQEVDGVFLAVGPPSSAGVAGGVAP